MTNHTDPYFSIVIPFNDRYELLTFCLDQLEIQDFINFEVLICKDGLSDNLLYDLTKHYNLDIKYIFCKSLGRPARARNEGAKSARGKYLLFCDDDDYFESNKLSTIYDTLKKSSNVFLSHRVSYFQLPSRSALAKSQDLHMKSRHACLSTQIFSGNSLCVSSFVIDKELHLTIGGFLENLVSGEDYIYSLCAIYYCHEFIFLPSVLGAYRIASVNEQKYYPPYNACNNLKTFVAARSFFSSKARGGIQNIHLINYFLSCLILLYSGPKLIYSTFLVIIPQIIERLLRKVFVLLFS